MRRAVGAIVLLLAFGGYSRAGAQTTTRTRFEALTVLRDAPVEAYWRTLPRVRVGVMRSAGDLNFRVGRLKSGDIEALGAEVRIDEGDDQIAIAYLDDDEIEPLIAALDSALHFKPAAAVKREETHEFSYETRGGFKISANQQGADEADYRFMIFTPIALFVAPHGKVEFRADGPAGVFVPLLLRGDPNDASNLLKLLRAGWQALKELRH